MLLKYQKFVIAVIKFRFVWHIVVLFLHSVRVSVRSGPWRGSGLFLFGTYGQSHSQNLFLPLTH